MFDSRSCEARHLGDIVGSPEELLATVVYGMEEEVDDAAFSGASEFNAGERIGSVHTSV